MVKIILLVILFIFSTSCAYEQFLTFYSELNYRGDSITFKSKQPDITDFTRFILNSKSYQVRGYWRFFAGTQYREPSTYYPFTDSVVGANNTPPYAASIRHGGLLETSQKSISFYSSYYALKVEKVITTASNDMTFMPRSIISTGYSNWTFFTGSSFDGNITCYISSRENHYFAALNSELSNVRSVIRGCLDRTETYLYAKDFDVPQIQPEDFLSNE